MGKCSQTIYESVKINYWPVKTNMWITGEVRMRWVTWVSVRTLSPGEWKRCRVDVGWSGSGDGDVGNVGQTSEEHGFGRIGPDVFSETVGACVVMMGEAAGRRGGTESVQTWPRARSTGSALQMHLGLIQTDKPPQATSLRGWWELESRCSIQSHKLWILHPMIPFISV